jgi:hypothetical protein
MGHPLAPSIMQQFSITVPRHLHQRLNVVMVAYLDNWLFIHNHRIPVGNILRELKKLGITINVEKSFLQPVWPLTYLGLNIDTTTMTHPQRPASTGPGGGCTHCFSHGPTAHRWLYCLARVLHGMAPFPGNIDTKP